MSFPQAPGPELQPPSSHFTPSLGVAVSCLLALAGLLSGPPCPGAEQLGSGCFQAVWDP